MNTAAPAVFRLPGSFPDAGVDLHDYDIVLINSSAGKDSQAMLAYLVALADAQGYDRSRIVVVHANLGRVEWPGTLELARAQAETYGLRFEVVARAEDLLDQVVTRRRTLDEGAVELWLQGVKAWQSGDVDEAVRLLAAGDRKRNTPAWMSSKARYCTADQKTSQVSRLMTRLAADWRTAGNTRPIRLLNCLGMRAAEGIERAKKTPLGPDGASNGRRTVTRWLPIFTWSDAEVWATIRASGLPVHPAYAAGMPRLSCVFCVLAPRRQLVLAARLNPDLAAEYVAVEQQVRHKFKADLSIAEVVAEARIQEQEGL